MTQSYDRGRKKFVCWKCRWLVLDSGFLRRKKKTGPCDRCLGRVTVFQQAWGKDIWIKHIPKKEKQPNKPKKESTGESNDNRSLNSDTQSS